MKHGSLFTGVGGIDLGFEKAGIETAWQCEINKQARSVLAKHWPNVTQYEDVTTVNGAEVTPVDIITFGSPCQDLSVAGKRAGFQDGTRSNLYFEAIRIIKEMRDKTNGQYPRYAVWENVRGALSSNDGRDFLAAVEALADLGALDISWRVVNTCHFGPPQRRVRVFLVADFGGERAGEILAESARVLWHPAQIGEAGQETSGETEEGVGVSGWVTARDTASTLQTGGPAGTRLDVEAAAGGQLLYKSIYLSTDKTIANCIPSELYHHGTVVNQDARNGHLVIEEQVPYVKVVRSGARNANGELPAEVWRAEQVGPTLNVFDNGSESRATVIVPEEESYRVRRLTPRECERLQGWPDDHTRWADTGKEVSDSARYKMCGNGVSAPVAQWIGENIMKGHSK